MKMSFFILDSLALILHIVELHNHNNHYDDFNFPSNSLVTIHNNNFTVPEQINHSAVQFDKVGSFSLTIHKIPKFEVSKINF